MEEDKQRIKHIFGDMKFRCYSDKCKGHNAKSYKDKGIKICDEWLNDFDKFYKWSITHGYKNDLTIDRIDTDGDYCPQNCRWVSHKEQMRNRTNTVKVEHNGEIHTVTEWAEILNISLVTVYHRIDKMRGKGVKDYHKALFTPVDVDSQLDNTGKEGKWEDNFNKWLKDNNICKKVRCVCKELDVDTVYNSISEASRATGIARSSIINNAKGKNKSCYKDKHRYCFSYIEN